MTNIAPVGRPAPRRVPWHLWMVAGLSLFWNAFGCFDWTMSHVQADAYFRQTGMSQEQIAQFHKYPHWMELFWALGVWGAMIGSVMLLVRSRWAVPMLAASLLGAVVNLLYSAVLALPSHTAPITVAITFIAASLALYAWAMRRAEVLA